MSAWDKLAVTYTLSLSKNDVLAILEGMDNQDTLDVICEYLDRNKKVEAGVKKFLNEAE